MDTLKEIACSGLAALLGAGAEKAQCNYTQTTRDELNVELGELSLLRTTLDTTMELAAIKERKRGSTVLNCPDRTVLQQAAADLIEIAHASAPGRLRKGCKQA